MNYWVHLDGKDVDNISRAITFLRESLDDDESKLDEELVDLHGRLDLSDYYDQRNVDRRQFASEHYGMESNSDFIVVDPDAAISEGDDCCWVQAWVYLYEGDDD